MGVYYGCVLWPHLAYLKCIGVEIVLISECPLSKCFFNITFQLLITKPMCLLSLPVSANSWGSSWTGIMKDWMWT